jgi:hypothetical protein
MEASGLRSRVMKATQREGSKSKSNRNSDSDTDRDMLLGGTNCRAEA